MHLRAAAVFVVGAATVGGCSSVAVTADPGDSAGPATPTTAIPVESTTSTPQPSTSSRTGSGAIDAATVCSTATVTGSVAWQTDDVVEASGLAASRRHEGVVWTHNDGGHPLGVHAFDADGRSLGFFAIPDAPNGSDPEDLAIGPGPVGDPDDHLYLADIGDNGAQRSSVVIHRFREPTPGADEQLEAAERLEVTYPDGPRDAESLVIDRDRRELVIVTKVVDTDADGRRSIGPAEIYVGDLDQQVQELRLVGVIDLEALAGRSLSTSLLGVLEGSAGAATAADVGPHGLIALRTYATVWIFDADHGRSVAERFLGEPCEAAAPIEGQGEAITWQADGRGYLTVAESSTPDLFHVDLP